MRCSEESIGHKWNVHEWKDGDSINEDEHHQNQSRPVGTGSV